MAVRFKLDENLPRDAEEILRHAGHDVETVLGERSRFQGPLQWIFLCGNEASRRLAGVPGIGPAIASAIVATAPDPRAFTSARRFAAWLGPVPRQHATGGRQSLGRIGKRGDSDLRRLPIDGAQPVRRWAKKGKSSPWPIALLEPPPAQRRRDRARRQDGADRPGDAGPRPGRPA